MFVDHTVIAAQDFTDLRTAVNAMLTAAELSTITFPNDIQPLLPVKLTHLTSLRNALDNARTQLGLPAIGYADPTATLSTSTPIRHQHVIELRGGVQ